MANGGKLLKIHEQSLRTSVTVELFFRPFSRGVSALMKSHDLVSVHLFRDFMRDCRIGAYPGNVGLGRKSIRQISFQSFQTLGASVSLWTSSWMLTQLIASSRGIIKEGGVLVGTRGFFQPIVTIVLILRSSSLPWVLVIKKMSRDSTNRGKNASLVEQAALMNFVRDRMTSTFHEPSSFLRGKNTRLFQTFWQHCTSYALRYVRISNLLRSGTEFLTMW